MKLSGLGKLLTILYNDRMDIYRTQSEENTDTTIDISYTPTPLYTDIPCRLSFSSDDSGADKEVDSTPVTFDPRLFCEHKVDLKAGDYVVVRRYADDGSIVKTYEGQVAMPSWYSTHQETLMRIDEGA